MTSEASNTSKMRESQPSVLHPRGRIAPPLPKETPLWQRLLRAVVRLGQGLFFHDAFRIAPAMAFHFFLSLLPLLVFVGWVIGALVRRRGVDTVLAPFLESLPASTGKVIEGEAHRLGGADRLGPLAAVGFFWIASGGTQGLMGAIEGVVGAPRRPWWRQRLLALAWVAASLVAIGIASFGVIQWRELFSTDTPVFVAPTATSSGGWAGGTAGPSPSATAPSPATSVTSSRKSRARTGPRTEPRVEPTTETSSATSTSDSTSDSTASTSASPAPSASTSTPTSIPTHRARRHVLRTDSDHTPALIFSIAGAIAGLAAFYWLSVSHSKRVKRRVFPGAALAVGLWLVISWGFGLYVRTLSNYAVFYGSLAAVAVLLVWLWLTSLTILVGAELNAQLEGLRD